MRPPLTKLTTNLVSKSLQCNTMIFSGSLPSMQCNTRIFSGPLPSPQHRGERHVGPALTSSCGLCSKCLIRKQQEKPQQQHQEQQQNNNSNNIKKKYVGSALPSFVPSAWAENNNNQQQPTTGISSARTIRIRRTTLSVKRSKSLIIITISLDICKLHVTSP